jgi:hypothetical protein
MSEFDKLKDEAGKEVKDHPEQVEQAEQAINKKAGIIIQDDEAAKRDQGGKPEGGGAGQSQGG